jgi:hypothetical protein
VRRSRTRLAFALLGVCCAVAAAAEPVPEIPPYRIPTFDGADRDFKAPVPAMAPAPEVDGDSIFRMVVNCFPERVAWGLELDAVAGTRWTEDNGITTFDTSGLARHYVGLVAKMPLYSATEINRERQTEYQRREQVATNLKALLSGLADRRRAQRELGLYTSLEARSQKRVALGIVEATEQIDFLEKVAQAQAKLDDANAQIEGARLALVGQCRDEVANQVNDYLKEVTR